MVMAGVMTLGSTVHGIIDHTTTGDGAAFIQAGTLRGHIADIGVHIIGDTTEDFMEDITEAFTVDITADTTQVIGPVVLTADLITATSTDARRIHAQETTMQTITGHRVRARLFPTEVLLPVQAQAQAQAEAQRLVQALQIEAQQLVQARTEALQPVRVRTELFAAIAMQGAVLL